MFLLASVVFALHALGSAQMGTNSSSALSAVAAAFTAAKIVPGVIPTFNPKAGLSPIFPGSPGPVQVLPGASLTMNETETPPQYLLTSNSTDLSTSNASWVITIVDPDAPSPQFLHFLGKDFVVDPNLVVEGGGLTNASGLMNTSQALAEFVGPNPPPGPAHRYVVLVYQQPNDFNTTAPAFFNRTNGTDFRQNFSISDFATNTSLGDPIAGSFFLVGLANVDNSTTTMISSSTASMSSSSTPPLSSVITPAPSPSSPSSPPPPPPQDPATTTTNVPSGGEKVTSWMSLLIATTLSVTVVLV